MTTDPRDAEIARLRMALAESEAAAEGALMILVQTQAERDAALAQVAGLVEDRTMLRSALSLVKKECDQRTRGNVSPIGTAAYMDVSITLQASFHTDALAALSRRDAQMRAEGMRMALDVVSENADWPEDEHGRTEHPALFARISHAILAAAEKEGRV